MRTRIMIAGVAVALLAGTFGIAFAGEAGGGGGRGGRGGFDPARMREMLNTRMKEALKVNDEEWKALQPKVEKVMTMSRELTGGGMRMAGGRRGGNQPAADNAEPQSLLVKAQADLQATLDKEDASADEIKTKLTAYREARELAKQELAKAQAELRELVTPRQEAQLVLMGYLD
ncbi:MAG TPA: hypothetical protein VM223_28635 [Planctomycetota bacterium]|nr:hypothetical protein [Planctomycetota bacterium]